MMRILWHSTVPWGASSYSVLTARTVPGIVKSGHDCAVSTWYGLQGAVQSWHIKTGDVRRPEVVVPILPQVALNAFGADMLLPYYAWFKANCVITCMDIWVLPPELMSRMVFVPWVPIDHNPAGLGTLRVARVATRVLAMSRWGRDVLISSGIDASYIPCSASIEQFKPLDMDTARKALGIPAEADFVASMVAANKDPADRKGFAVAMRAFKLFSEAHPKAKLYVHTDWNGPININNLGQQLGFTTQLMQSDQFMYKVGMLTEEYLQNIYSASDVLLNPAKSEGFGLPLLEAQMCGCPIAATDFSTTDELLFAGWKIAGQPCWSFGAESWRYEANIDSIVAALEAAYAARGDETLRRRARRGARVLDTITVATRYWKPFLAELEQQLTVAEGHERELKEAQDELASREPLS